MTQSRFQSFIGMVRLNYNFSKITVCKERKGQAQEAGIKGRDRR
jgi:hypothetical protein